MPKALSFYKSSEPHHLPRTEYDQACEVDSLTCHVEQGSHVKKRWDEQGWKDGPDNAYDKNDEKDAEVDGKQIVP